MSDVRSSANVARDGASGDPSTASLRPRPNTAWWQAHGGDEWLREVELRRPMQPRYALQEAWLLDHFRPLPPLRVLDFGCGYGRHLRNLRALPNLDLYGCDMSPTMFAKIPEYVGDESWARERTRLVEPMGRLPFEDRFFDVTYVSEVLIHVDPDDLSRVLAELVRVTWQRLVLIENKRTEQTRLGNREQEGCWLHDLEGALEGMGIRGVQVAEDVLADQDIYLVDLLGSGSSRDQRRAGEALRARDDRIAEMTRRVAALEREMAHRVATLEGEVAGRDAALSEAIRERIVADVDRIQLRRSLDEVGRELYKREAPLARRILHVADSLGPNHRLVRRFARGAAAAMERLAPKPPSPELRARPGELPFAGIAKMARPNTPEAFLAMRPRVVSICHPDWRGIRAATYSLCDAVLEIPVVADEQHAEAIGRLLAEAGTQVVVVQGIPPGTQRLMVALRKRHPGLRLLQVFHGSSAQHTLLPDEAALLDDMLGLASSGVLDGVGLVKAGMAEALRRCGYRTYGLYNKVPPVDPPPRPHPLHEHTHIGVFVPDLWVKNINTQVLAALALPGTTVHVTEAPRAQYLQRFKRRIAIEGMLRHEDFLRRMGEMDANLYVSLSECYPMTVLESLERGVPCLTSHTSPIFDDEPYLFERLVVTRHDDAFAIARQLENALADRAEIVARGHAHLTRLNARADELWRAFTNG